jgi:acetyltransferase-like isoleucine patch superfamily enzyme
VTAVLDLAAHLSTVVFQIWRGALRAALRRSHRTQFTACGENVAFDPLTSEIGYGHVRVGSNVHIGPGGVMGHAQIGDDVMFGPDVHLRDGNHRYDVVGRAAIDSGSTEPGLVVIGQ